MVSKIDLEYEQGLSTPIDSLYLNYDQDSFDYSSPGIAKGNSEELKVYHPHSGMLSIPEEFATAPAAFGVYPEENFYESNYYDYPNYSAYQEYYDIEQSFETVTDVNPAMLDANYGYLESSQTVLDCDFKKTRQQAQPTNVIPNGKMDRKTLKRLRNRVSASRCRIKKKEWISEMEDESMQLHEENNFLLKKIQMLEESLLKAKQMLEYYQSPV